MLQKKCLLPDINAKKKIDKEFHEQEAIPGSSKTPTPEPGYFLFSINFHPLVFSIILVRSVVFIYRPELVVASKT